MLIAIEGANASGKSTLAANLVKELTEAEYVRFPGYSSNCFCSDTRDLISDYPDLNKYSKLFLYLADMAEFYSQDRNGIYILDRSYISTLVYQTLEGIDESFLRDCISRANIYVDKCILLDCDASVANSRKQNRNTKTIGGFDKKGISFLEKARKKYTKYVPKDAYILPSHMLSEQELLDRSLKKVKEWISFS